MYNWELTVTILAIWSASLLQFTLVLTASTSKKSRAGFKPRDVREREREREREGREREREREERERVAEADIRTYKQTLSLQQICIYIYIPFSHWANDPRNFIT